MTPRQYRNALETLGLTQEEFSRQLEIGTRTSYRWAAGDGPIPHAVALVLRYWLATGMAPDEISREKAAETV